MTSTLDRPDLTRDDFLGGRLRVWQPARGYRAGIDPVLLAAAVPARAGEAVLELGCGVAVASLCLGARVADLALTGLEVQPDYADLARRNAAENGQPMIVITGDLATMPAVLKAQQFDHVMANPPYFKGEGRAAAADAGREMALAGATPLSAWVAAAARRLRPRGRATFIQRADRLPELLTAMADHLGSLHVQPLVPRSGRPARLVIAHGLKGGRGGFRLAAPLTLHAGAAHLHDGDDYTATIADVLRNGAALPHGD